jgi:hypothetical protein
LVCKVNGEIAVLEVLTAGDRNTAVFGGETVYFSWWASTFGRKLLLLSSGWMTKPLNKLQVICSPATNPPFKYSHNSLFQPNITIL